MELKTSGNECMFVSVMALAIDTKTHIKFGKKGRKTLNEIKPISITIFKFIVILGKHELVIVNVVGVVLFFCEQS